MSIVRYAGFNNYIRHNAVDHILYPDCFIRKLNYGSSHPTKRIGVSLI